MYGLMLSLLALSAHTSQASQLDIQPEQNFDRLDRRSDTADFPAVCLPTRGIDTPQLDAPCWAMQAIELECKWNLSIQDPAVFRKVRWPLSLVLDPGHYDVFVTDAHNMSAADQRLCFCQSQWVDQNRGCRACAQAHDVELAVPIDDVRFAMPPNYVVNSVTSSYCAASNTPTAGFGDVIFSAFSWSRPYETVVFVTGSMSYADPLASRTEASLYFTPAVSPTDVWPVIPPTTASATPMAAFGDLHRATNIQSGQIVPITTRVSTRSGSGAVETGMPEKVALAGVVGFAAAVALL